MANQSQLGQNQSRQEPYEQVPPSPSLLSRVKWYWKLNLPKAYARMSEKHFQAAVRQTESQIALLVSQGYSLSGANEVVYPSLFPEPESESQEQEEKILS